MKKRLSVLLALLMMLLPLCACAEMDYEIYLYPDESAGFAYLSNWMLISRETIDEMFEQAKEEDMGGLGATLEALAPQMEQMDIVMMLNPETSDNINVVRTDTGKTHTAEELLEQANQMKALLPMIYENVVVQGDAELLETGDGGPAYALLLYSTQDVEGRDIAMVQAITAIGTRQYVITLTLYPTTEAHQDEALTAMQMAMMTLTEI